MLPNLESLVISGSYSKFISCYNIRHFISLTHLKELNIQCPTIDHLAEFNNYLTSAEGIIALSIKQCRLNKGEIASLIDAICTCKSLRFLQLDIDKIDSVKAIHQNLAKLAENLPFLQRLEPSGLGYRWNRQYILKFIGKAKKLQYFNAWGWLNDNDNRNEAFIAELGKIVAGREQNERKLTVTGGIDYNYFGLNYKRCPGWNQDE